MEKILRRKRPKFGIDRFGESAPYKKIYEHFNLSEEKIVTLIQEKLKEIVQLMDKIKFFSENLDVKNKTIILRLDLNVPLTEKNSRRLQEF